MRLVKCIHRGQELTSRCYDNHKDFMKDAYVYNYTLCEKRTPCEGAYILTDNGWYVPILKVVIFDNLKNNKSMIRFYIPRRVYTFFINHNDKVRHSAFVFYPDQKVLYKLPKARYVVIAMLMEQGMPIFEAVAYAFPKHSEKNNLRVVTTLMNEESILNLIKGQAMSRLKDEMLNQGISAEWYVKQLKDILSDTKSNPNLKKYALEQIGRTIEQEEKRNINYVVGLQLEANAPKQLQSNPPLMLEKKEN